MRPLERVAATAQQVAELPLDRGDVALSVRVPEADTDPHTEVGKVGAALNRMLGHVASALTARQASEQQGAAVRRGCQPRAAHAARLHPRLRRADPARAARAAAGRRRARSAGSSRRRSRMTSLVEDLLLLARLDEGRELDRDPVDLSLLLIDAVSDAHAAGPDHELDARRCPRSRSRCSATAPRLHQVVVNLLANARVHTPGGHDGDGGAARRRGDRTRVDHGRRRRPGHPGGAAADAVRALRPRRQLASARDRLDRARARDRARAWSRRTAGAVSVRSEPGDTVFTVALPLA